MGTLSLEQYWKHSTTMKYKALYILPRLVQQKRIVAWRGNFQLRLYCLLENAKRLLRRWPHSYSYDGSFHIQLQLYIHYSAHIMMVIRTETIYSSRVFWNTDFPTSWSFGRNSNSSNHRVPIVWRTMKSKTAFVFSQSSYSSNYKMFAKKRLPLHSSASIANSWIFISNMNDNAVRNKNQLYKPSGWLNPSISKGNSSHVWTRKTRKDLYAWLHLDAQWLHVVAQASLMSMQWLCPDDCWFPFCFMGRFLKLWSFRIVLHCHRMIMYYSWSMWCGEGTGSSIINANSIYSDYHS